MIPGTNDDKREDEDDDRDNNEGERDDNDDIDDAQVYYGQDHQEEQDYEDMNCYDPDDQSYDSADLPNDNNENQIEMAGTTLITNSEDMTTEGKNKELYPILYSMVEENEENEEMDEERDDVERARKDIDMISDPAVLLMDPVNDEDQTEKDNYQGDDCKEENQAN